MIEPAGGPPAQSSGTRARFPRRDMRRHDQAKFEGLVAEAVAHHRARHFEAAEVGYRAALGISPGHPAVTHNLGVLAVARGDLRSAMRCFEDVIATEPGYAPAHFNRGLALQELGRPREALQAYGRVIVLEPDHYDAHRALGFLWLAERDRGRALDHFARTYELRRGEDRTDRALRSMTWSSRTKLLHDAGQFAYLAGRHADRQRFEVLAGLYARLAQACPDRPAPLDDALRDALGEEYNGPINACDAPEAPGGAVNERLNTAAILRGFESADGSVFFDALLRPAALANLKRHLLESTIWHEFAHIDGFVASYLEDGLACPVLLQIADQLRDTFRALLDGRPLTQAWAFKGVKNGASIGAHADDGAISVNFWMTSDDANLAHGRGGMVLCKIPPPADWRNGSYDADRAKAEAFLEANEAAALRVPYRENRAVLFRSNLTHRSDAPQFAAGYENQRINITLLYGGKDETARKRETA